MNSLPAPQEYAITTDAVESMTIMDQRRKPSRRNINMKRFSIVILLLVFSATFICEMKAQARIWQQSVVKTGISVRAAPVVVGQVNVTVPKTGNVLLTFDGDCSSTVGDRIVLAASNITDWGTNDGAVSVEAFSATVNSNSFSHTRMYPVTAGNYTFYAVTQNYVETAGSGIVSIYGSLTAKFFPEVASEPIVRHQGIVQTNINLRGAPVVVGQKLITIPRAGFVLVRFDGQCVSSVGDLIVLAASNIADWGTNDGNVAVAAASATVDRNSFSHSRIYPVSAGNYTFYAVAQNYVDMTGTGIASIYGSLTVEFYPTLTSNVPFVKHQGLAQTSLNVRGTPKVVGSLTINPTSAGKAFVHFDGQCASSVGDLIVLAASTTADWGINDGNVSVEATSATATKNSFSHTRVYTVASGSHTFYAVAQNYVHTAGSGLASIYGSLTVSFFPDNPTEARSQDAIPVAFALAQNYPNPFNPSTTIRYELPQRSQVTLAVFNTLGQRIAELVYGDQEAGSYEVKFDGNGLSSGVYFYRLRAGDFVRALKMTVVK
jgi:hypothetical protein